MRFRAVLKNAKSGVPDVKSVWFHTEEEAQKAAELGMDLYRAKSFVIEEEEPLPSFQWTDQFKKAAELLEDSCRKADMPPEVSAEINSMVRTLDRFIGEYTQS